MLLRYFLIFLTLCVKSYSPNVQLYTRTNMEKFFLDNGLSDQPGNWMQSILKEAFSHLLYAEPTQIAIAKKLRVPNIIELSRKTSLTPNNLLLKSSNKTIKAPSPKI